MRGGHRRGRFTVTLGMLLACSTCAFGLNPDLDISQYAHKSWTVRDGFFKSGIDAIAQTPDGYLWLGTQFGLLRFDGVKAEPWQPPGNQHLPDDRIRSLLVTRDGTLWIGTRQGLSSWKDNRLTPYPELAGQAAGAMIEDRDGTVWAGGFGIVAVKLCAIQKGEVTCFGQDGRFGRSVLSLYEDDQRSLWVGTGSQLWRWKPAPPIPVAASSGIYKLIGGENGVLWIAEHEGLRQLIGEKIEPYRLPVDGPFAPHDLLRDRENSLWIGTSDRGLIHVRRGRTDGFGRVDGLSGDIVAVLFEDREGNVWVGTTNGLDRFRDYAAATVSSQQGLAGTRADAVLAARDGSVWLTQADGLKRVDPGQVSVYRGPRGSSPAPFSRQKIIAGTGLPDRGVQSLFQDSRGRIWVTTDRGSGYLEDGRFQFMRGLPSGQVHGIAEDTAGDLWFADQDAGLFRLSPGGDVQSMPWATLGHRDFARALAADPVQGGLWLGFALGGLAYFRDGQIRASHSSAEGLGGRVVNDIRVEKDGTLWAATQGGLSRLQKGRITTFSSKNGLPCDPVYWSLEDGDHSMWLYMPCGLARVARAELDQNRQTLRAAVFDASDGVELIASAGGLGPMSVRSADGRIWFRTTNGLGVVDPRRIPFNRLPPPVQIEKVIADRKTYAVDAARKLPPLTRDLEIDYTALSLVDPERTRFRYKLEGKDPDWQDVGTRRQAFYNDLPPRHYRFRVMACNNSGVWNEAGASFDFSVAPAYYQTTWFRSLVVAAFLASLAGLYQLRLRYLEHQYNVRMEERVNERTRIARDLHDTLLQSFQGVLLKFSAIKYVMRSRPDEAEETLDRLIEQARTAVTEGRDAVQGLRSSVVVTNDLARAITTFGEALASDQDGVQAPEFRVVVEGSSKDLVPLIRDEVYRITGEALRNAFRHGRARRIEVEIHYDARRLRMRVRDYGKGIDPQVLGPGGRTGHHGLPGMRERAELVGGKLAVWSELNSGTEIELTIPAAIAYTKSAPARRSRSAGKGTE